MRAGLFVGFFTVFDSIDEDYIGLQRKQHTKRTDAQPIFRFVSAEFPHVASQTILQNLKASSDVPAVFPGQTAQILAGFDAEKQSIAHDPSQPDNSSMSIEERDGSRS